jgi:hypothetical protein
MRTFMSTVQEVIHQGLVHRRSDSSLLTEAQSRYALERLWELVAGSATWEGPPTLAFDAVDPLAVQNMLAIPAGAMAWIDLSAIAPEGWTNPFDTESLPALCAVAANATAFNGIGPFPLDLVTATFIQLTCWEEWSRPALDQFGCQEEDASVAARQRFRDRPVLDEWAAVLRAWLEAKRSSWRAALPAHGLDVSHDVDLLRYYKSPLRVLRRLARRLVVDRHGLASLSALGEGARSLFDPNHDPCVKAFDALMSFSESLGARSTFFFMSARPGPYDDGYEVSSPLFGALRDRIRARGHQLGWHPGYAAAEDDFVFVEEMQRYARAIDSTEFGVRHHYLRWRAASSWRRLAAHGRPFDASVGYNYCVGFRASTARPYPAFDLAQNVQLDLQVRPLIAMDGPLQRNPSPIAEHLARIANRCWAVNGTLTLLVHNYSLMNAPDLLREIAEGLRAAGRTT